MNNKKWYKNLGLVSIIFLINVYVVLTDTGFDVDYDLGGGEFDFGVGSGSSGFSFGGSSLPFNKVFVIVFFIGLGLTIIIDVIKKK